MAYIGGMKKSCDDKLFFLDYLSGVDTVVDFGCADGEILKRIRDKFPLMNLIGIDCNEEMLMKAQNNVKHCEFIRCNTVPMIPKETTRYSALNMSSVIHEVYAYSENRYIKRFWNDVFDSGYKYISIRDLMLDHDSYRPALPEDIEKLRIKANFTQLKDFEKLYGNVRFQNNLIHFLMKYRYLENWKREVEENYFPIMVEEFLSKIPTDRYRIVYFKHYPLPFNQKKIFEDFGIILNDNTHVKILLERK